METQQALVANGLRHKIRLQVDGGLKTGLDIIKAAILGAESFGFGTGPMVALGCKYLRICHLNNCATGVATQDDKLRKNHYHGLPFKVTNYFEFIARETRELMAQLGVKRLVDLIGRTDLLKELDGFTAKQQKPDLGKLLETAEPHPGKALYCTENNPPFDNGVLNAQLLQQAKPYVDEKQSKTFWFDIRNTDRSVGPRCPGISPRPMATRDWRATRSSLTLAAPRAELRRVERRRRGTASDWRRQRLRRERHGGRSAGHSSAGGLCVPQP